MTGNTLSGLLDVLVWILIFLVIVAVIGAVVRTVTATRDDTLVERPIVLQPVQQPPATSGLAPGWYPDQNDPNSLRYFDGRGWTSQTQARR